MRAYKLIISNNYKNEPLAENTFYFRLEFTEIFKDNKVTELNEFVNNLNKKVFEVKNEFKIILEKFMEKIGNINTFPKFEVWKNNYNELVVSAKGSFEQIENKDFLLTTLNEIKKDLLANEIFVRLLTSW